MNIALSLIPIPPSILIHANRTPCSEGDVVVLFCFIALTLSMVAILIKRIIQTELEIFWILHDACKDVARSVRDHEKQVKIISSFKGNIK